MEHCTAAVIVDPRRVAASLAGKQGSAEHLNHLIFRHADLEPRPILRVDASGERAAKQQEEEGKSEIHERKPDSVAVKQVAILGETGRSCH